MVQKLTKRAVDALQPGQTAYDVEVHGFGVRCGPRHRSYHVKCLLHGRQKWLTIGKHGSPWTVETARKRAIELLLQVRRGIDPRAVEKARREQQMTLAELSLKYLKEHAEPYKSASSVRLDRTNLENHVLPLLGRRYVSEITRADITRFQQDVASGETARPTPSRNGAFVRGGRVVANRCIVLLSKMFNLAEEWELRRPHSNPAKGLNKFSENRRERFLSREEFQRLGRALEQVAITRQFNPYAMIAIHLLLLTGARLGEIQTLKWDWVDLDRGLLLLPNSKTGQKAVRLSEAAKEVLRTVPRIKGNPHVIVGYGNSYLKNMHAPWTRIRRVADLSDLRLHDLRHTFASVAAAQGKSLQIIGGLLGHARTETTERYAHLRPDDVSAAAQATSAYIQKLLGL